MPGRTGASESGWFLSREERSLLALRVDGDLVGEPEPADPGFEKEGAPTPGGMSHTPAGMEAPTLAWATDGESV